MQFPISSSPFTPSHNSVQRIMAYVLIALLPAIFTLFYLFGFSVLIQIVLAVTTAILAEGLCLYLRKKALVNTISDLSAVITAVLLALAIPSIAPWWVIVSGTFFAIVIAKQVYGGLGYNPFNPAMVGYVFLLVSFPLPMTIWQNPSLFLSLNDALAIIFFELPSLDSFSGATVLDYTKTQLQLGQTISLIQNHGIFGFVADKHKEFVSLAYLIGGLFLALTKIIRWTIPCAVLLGIFIPASIAYTIDSNLFISPWLHLASGSTFCAAFFIATDPVSATSSVKGQIFYGLLIGSLIYCIRTWGGYPDATAFAILLANLSAPSIDYYLKPKRNS